VAPRSQNNFLLKDAWEHQQRGYSVTHLAYVKGILAGYITLGNDVVDLTVDERPESAPAARISAVKVFQFAVDKRFKRQGLGEELLNLAVLYARENAVPLDSTGAAFLRPTSLQQRQRLRAVGLSWK
jgi:GNAT superfamily N-acetyltransferase